MSFFDLFKSRESREKLSHLKNLVALACADGKFQESEIAAIASIMHRDGLTQADFERCFKNPHGIKFIPPETDEKRLMYLKDMVLLMMCDGHIDEKEMTVCKMTAIMLGYKHEVIDALVLAVIADLKKELGL